MVGSLVSFWDGFLAGAMLVSGRVQCLTICITAEANTSVCYSLVLLLYSMFSQGKSWKGSKISANETNLRPQNKFQGKQKSLKQIFTPVWPNGIIFHQSRFP